MQTWNSIVERLKNKGTVLAIIGGIVTILIQLGFKVDSEQVMTVVEIICGLLIALGIMNNPVGNKKAYIPGISDALVEKKVKEEPQKSTEVSNVKIPVAEEGVLKADLITTGVIKTEAKEEVETEEQPTTPLVEEVK